MKILQVISIGHISGGAEKSVFLLKQGLQDQGHEVMVVASDFHADDSVPAYSDITFPALDSKTRSMPMKLLYHLWYPAAYRCLKATIKEFKPDIVHFHTMGQLSPASVFAVGSTPAVLTVHGPEEYTLNLLQWYLPRAVFEGGDIQLKNLTAIGRFHYAYYRFLQRPLYKLAFRRHLKRLIAPSKYMADLLEEENYKVTISQVYNGIDLPAARPVKQSNRLLYVGRLEHVKGVDILIRAMTKVAAAIPSVHLTVVGDGNVRQELEKYTDDHNLNKNITFKGWVENAQVLRYYYDTSAFVIPSIWPENLPTVCIEALAAGRPVIGSRTGGIPELVNDGKTGRIVEPEDPNELASAIESVLGRKDLAKWSTQAAKSMQRFDIKTFIKNTEQVYKEVISEHSRR